MLPDKASLHLTAIEDSEYKEDKIECECIDLTRFLVFFFPTLILMSVEICIFNFFFVVLLQFGTVCMVLTCHVLRKKL